MEEIKGLLLELNDPDSGARVVERVEIGTDIFSGPQTPAGPDMVAVPRTGYEIKGRMSREIFVPRGLLSGMHTHDDAFVFASGGAGQQLPSHIRGLAALMEKTRSGNL